jgi:hypothetical protein
LPVSRPGFLAGGGTPDVIWLLGALYFKIRAKRKDLAKKGGIKMSGTRQMQ